MTTPPLNSESQKQRTSFGVNAALGVQARGVENRLWKKAISRREIDDDAESLLVFPKFSFACSLARLILEEAFDVFRARKQLTRRFLDDLGSMKYLDFFISH